MNIKDYIAKEENFLVNLRQWFHMHPEGSMKEFNTCEKIASILDEIGVYYSNLANYENAIVAIIKGKKPNSPEKNKVIALRCDIDALDMMDLKKGVKYRSKNKGYCHACGHDAHTAALIVAAKVLKEREDEFSGEIRLFFQPGEEIGAGANLYINAGLLEDVHRIFGLHVAPHFEYGKVTLSEGTQFGSCDRFTITVKGASTHVATPERGVDALYIATQIVNNLQSIVSRSTNPTEAAVVSVGTFNAGTRYNIVADSATLVGTTRAFTSGIRESTNEKVIKIAKETGKLYGAKCIKVIFEPFAPPLINSKIVVEEALETIASIVGKENIVKNKGMLGADDFAYFLEKTEGLYSFVGTMNKDVQNSDRGLHNGFFDIDEKALLICCNLYVDFALKYLS